METNTEHSKVSTETANAVEPTTRHGLTHGDEYRFLREEIMQRIKDIHQTEIFGAVGVGLVYSWCILNKNDISSPILWFIGPCVVALCGISCAVNVAVIWHIGRYLARIESVVFADDELKGWEHEQNSPIQRRYAKGHFALSVSLWVVALTATIWASWSLSQQ